jgi:type 1 fimbria pilin
MVVSKHGFQRPLSPGVASTSRGRGRSPRQLGMLAWSAGLALLVLAAPAASAARPAVETIHFGGTFSQADANPCTGAPGTFTVTFKGVSHTTTNPDGTVHHTATVNGEQTFTPDDPDQPSYTGRFTAWDGQNGTRQTITLSAAFHDRLTGSDGSKIRDRGVVHMTLNANGTVTVDFDRFVLQC